ncbi:MAG: hypothetical protein ACYSUI_18760 [Planctomycetota bacterium]|jgi:hypothetical protein
MGKVAGMADSRPSTGVRMGDAPKGGQKGRKRVKAKGEQGLGPSGGSWKGVKDSRPSSKRS